MKKCLCTLVVLFAVLTVAAGISSYQQVKEFQGDDADTQPITELEYSWWGDLQSNEKTRQALQRYSELHPNLVFRESYGEWTDYWTRISYSAAEHQLPDIVQTDYAFLQTFVDRLMLTPLDMLVANGVIDLSNLNPTMVDMGRINGKLYGICCGVSAPVLLYNQTLLDKYSIDVPETMTLTDFAELCREVYQKTRYKSNLTSARNLDFLNYVLRGSGKSLFDGDELGISSPEDVLPFFELYETAVTEGWLIDPEGLAQRRAFDNIEQNPLIMGNGASNMSWCAFVTSDQYVTAQRKANSSIELGMTPWPATDVAAANYIYPSQFYSISVDSDQLLPSADVINFFLNDLDALYAMSVERGISSNNQYAQVQKESEEPLVLREIEYLNQVAHSQKQQISASYPSGMLEINALLDDLQKQMREKTLRADEAATAFFQRAERILSN